MSTITVCDCCGGKEDVRKATMTRDGIHRPQPARRGDPVANAALGFIDLCAGCIDGLSSCWHRMEKLTAGE